MRYNLASAKTAEAKETLVGISRAAVGAYERETLLGGLPAHQLCQSSTRVPGQPPGAEKHRPSAAPGVDFDSGDTVSGWKCLRLGAVVANETAMKLGLDVPHDSRADLTTALGAALSEGTYYAYQYQKGVGSGKSGATPNGFEASAQGDLNGNGVYSFFARGADVRNGTVFLST